MKKTMFLLFFVISLQGMYASEFQVFLDSHESYVGQALQLTMQISSNKVVERPLLNNIDGFQISPAGEYRYEQRSLGGGSGSRTVTMEYSWRLLPLKTGTLRIPAFELELEDGTVSSSEIEILIREPGPLEGYHLFLTVQGDTVFPGVPVRLNLKWLFSSEVSRPEFSLPFLNQEDLRVVDLPPPSSQSSDVYQFKVDGRTVYAVQSAEIYEGEQYASLNMSWDIYPGEEGILDIEPVFLSFQRTILNRQGRKTYAPAVIPSNELKLNVKALPGEMKNFPGGILVSDDVLNIGIELDQTRIYPGDPLELTLTLEGLSSPEITEFTGFSDFEELKGIIRVDKGSLISAQQEQTKTYTQKIRIETDTLEEFPALIFPYYSLKKGKVETAVSRAIPLTIFSLDETASSQVSEKGGFLYLNHTDDQENPGKIELKANQRIRHSLINRLVYTGGLMTSFILFAVTLLLLALPFLFKAVSSLRFGRVESDIRVTLKKAVKEYRRRPDRETGQKLHELLIQWRRMQNFGDDESLRIQDLIETLGKSLWGDESERTVLSTDTIIKMIQEHLIKHLNSKRVVL